MPISRSATRVAGSIGGQTAAVVASEFGHPADVDLPTTEWDTAYDPPATTVYVSSTGYRNDGTTEADYTTLSAAYSAISRDTTIKIRNADTLEITEVTLGSKTGSGWIYIEPEDMTQVPAEGTRVVSGRHSDTDNIGTIPTIQLNAVGGSEHGSLTLSGSTDVYFCGIKVMPNASNDYQGQSSLINLRNTTRIVFDRCILTTEGRNQVRRALYIASGSSYANYTVVKNCEIEISNDYGSGDSQGILGLGQASPVLIENNTIRSASELLMTGGADVPSADDIPQDWTIRGNWFHWPVALYGDNGYNGLGQTYTLKNHLEIKLGIRFLIENNVFENHWDGATSQYFPIVFKGTNQDGTTDYAPVCHHATMRNNRLHNMQTGFLTFAAGDNYSGGSTASTQHIAVYNNLFTQYGTLVSGVPDAADNAIRGLQTNEKTGYTPSYRYFYHNTVEGEGGTFFFGVDSVEHTTIVFNNLVSAVDNAYGAIRHDGTPLWDGVTVAQNAVTPSIPSQWSDGNSGFSARTNAFSSVFQDRAGGDLRPATDLAGLADQTLLATGYLEIGCKLDLVAAAVSGARTQGDLYSGTP
jgi:hypothetical protein